jgi:succinyl-diaminopimelate desuccinylase
LAEVQLGHLSPFRHSRESGNPPFLLARIARKKKLGSRFRGNDEVLMSLAVELAKKLIACPSVTPARGAVFDALAAMLAAHGFTVDRFTAGEAPDGPVENLLAWRGQGGPHFAFAGHLDVVPPGEGWSTDPFTPVVRGELLHGRGAVDMKGSIAAFVAALDRAEQRRGTISLIITGDEEGPAVFGTRALIERMAERGLHPDLCLVGEPTSVHRLGDTIKIGRRGSVNIWIEVPGVQGHVAYPHLADNPIPKLIRALARIDAIELDQGTDWFQPSNIEVTELEVGNPATNVIPTRARARLSIRFNDLHRGDDLAARIRGIVLAEAPDAVVRPIVSGEAFLTQPGPLSDLVAAAIEAQTGLAPELSTSGGTSDARFLSRLCPVVEFGLPNATMHKLDEAVALADLERLTAIYADIIAQVQASAR